MPPDHEFLQKSQSETHFSYFFVDYSDRNTTDLPNLAVTDEYLNLSELAANKRIFQAVLVARYFFVFNYVIHETKARWIYRGADDSMMNVTLLGKYLKRLDRRYDPLSEVVVRGHCVVEQGHDYPFPQGGSGLIMSRRAVEKLAPVGVQSLKDMDSQEDQQFSRVLEGIGLNIVKGVASRAFLGTAVSHAHRDILAIKNFSALEECPADPCPKCLCPRWVVPLRQVIFTHGWHWESFEQRSEIAKGVWNAPRNVYWYSGDGTYPTLCRLDTRIVKGWDDDDQLV